MVDFEEWYDSHCSKVVSLKRFAESRICFVVSGRLWVVFHEQWSSLRQRLGISPIPLTWCHSAYDLPRAPLLVYGMSRLVVTLPSELPLRYVLAGILQQASPHPIAQIGSAHVRTPVTNAPLVCRLLLEKITLI